MEVKNRRPGRCSGESAEYALVGAFMNLSIIGKVFATIAGAAALWALNSAFWQICYIGASQHWAWM